MATYITSDHLRDYIGSDITTAASLADAVCTVASRTIETMCDRVFFADTTATARHYSPESWSYCPTDDFYTTTGLAVVTDDSANGTYSTAWTLDTDYYVSPMDGVSGGITGYPFTEIISLQLRAFVRPAWILRRPPVRITAKWGWAAVPDAVTQACLVAAARLFKMKDSADGFVGVAGWGPVQIKENPEVRALLYPYMKNPYVVV